MVKHVFLVCILLLLIPLAAAETPTVEELEGCVFFFTGAECEACDRAEAHLDETLLQKYPDVTIHKHQVYYNQDHAELLNHFFSAFNVPEEAQGIPAVIVRGSYYVGEKPIKQFVQNQLDKNPKLVCPSLDEQEVVGVTGKKTSHDVSKILNFGSVTAAGFKESLSPAMIAFLLIMLAYLSVIRDEENIVKKGAVFIGILYFVHFLSGMGLFTGLGTAAAFLFYKIVGVLAIVTGTIKIKGFLSTWKVFTKGMPEDSKRILLAIREFVMSWQGVAAVAILASIFTLVEGSTIFHLMQSLFAQNVLTSRVFPMILYYSFLISLPAVIIVVALRLTRQYLYDEAEEKGKNSEVKVRKWEKYYHRMINFCVSIVLVIVGLILLFV